MGLMIKKTEKKIPIKHRIDMIKGLEKLIKENFAELHRLYYDGLTEDQSRRLIEAVLSDCEEHYVIPR